VTGKQTATLAILAALSNALRNREVPFTPAERDALGLTNRLPVAVLTLGQAR
jgi:malate dehydrogenase (oxaloacetate-decarboxylating)